MSFKEAATALEHQDFPKAFKLFTDVTEQTPANATAWFGRALAAEGLSDLTEAVASYRKTVELKPEFMEAWANLGVRLRTLEGAVDEVEVCYKKALELAPDHPELLFNLANFYLDREVFTEAIKLYEGVIAAQPDHHKARQNLIEACKEVDLPKALNLSEALFKDQPNNVDAQFSLSLLQLANGDFENGFRNFNARRKLADLKPRHLGIPQWDGSDLNGKKVLVHAEQGLGDTLMMLRFVPKFYEMGAKVVLQCSKLVAPLIEKHEQLISIVTSENVDAEADYQIPMLGLPEYFIKQESDIFGEAYLNVPAKEGLEGSFKVGVVWAGNPDHKNDHNRSCLLKVLAPLFGEDVTFYSLQVGAGSEQITSDMNLLDVTGDLKSFKETAAMVKGLDLVISIDSAVAHLAGALGVKTWVMIPRVGCDWRWQRERVDSPWYDSVTLYRQGDENGWQKIVSKMQADLSALMRAK